MKTLCMLVECIHFKWIQVNYSIWIKNGINKALPNDDSRTYNLFASITYHSVVYGIGDYTAFSGNVVSSFFLFFLLSSNELYFHDATCIVMIFANKI